MLLNKKNMKKNRIPYIASLSILALSLSVNARENIGVGSGIAPKADPTREVMAGCSPATAQIDLDINNVRTKLLTGGDMWWDLNDAKYEVPKPKPGEHGPSSIFAGSLWIGGLDQGGQLKVAAMTYRQTGNDYWPGPLNATASVDPTVCSAYDRFYKIDKLDVKKYHQWILDGGISSGQANPLSGSKLQDILDWPTVGPEGQALAPYFDFNSDNYYDPTQGDYPDFDLEDVVGAAGGLRACQAKLKGDQAIWWVFNDKGNAHTETGGTSIGLEIQASAFAFITNDEINDMTFYTYKIINKSSFKLNQTHFGVWVDADLGGYNDDYVGCDVSNGFGYQYNKDGFDEDINGVKGYGNNPPAVGVDFFEGPFADANGLDDASSNTINGIGYNDGVVDNERLGMERFIYYNNNSDPINGNPNNPTDFYNYLTGKWQNSAAMTYGGTGVGGSTPCKFVFPDDSDPTGFGTNGSPQAPWSEWREGNPSIDRRFMQVAGPFTLNAGAVNIITTGVVWARATQGGQMASLALLKGADKKAQKLFNNCFKKLAGPDAPDLTIQEMNKELILYWTNPKGSNNYQEQYAEDPDLAVGGDSLYRFQGYQIYQLKDGTVSNTELNNLDRARLVFQCDKKDGIKQIINYTFDQSLTANIPMEMVNGADAGVVHSLSVTTDQFATGDNRLVNHKTYYYTIVAYGYSATQEFNPLLFSYGDFKPYISGSGNPQKISAIPHIYSPELAGTEAHSVYGTGVKVKRIEGQGNGGNALEMTAASFAEATTTAARSLFPVYENGHAPISVKVIDPLNVPNESFRIYITDTSDIRTPATALSENVMTTKARWVMVRLPGGNKADTIYSDASIETQYEQILNGQANGNSLIPIPKLGLSVTITYNYNPGAPEATKNGVLAADCSITFADPSKQWFTGLPDDEGATDQNWIRSGNATVDPAAYNDISGVDDGQDFEKVITGTWAPYRVCASTSQSTPLVNRGGPAWHRFQNQNDISNTASVDVVITADKSKWTRCPVLEMQDEVSLAVGKAPKMSLRRSPSVDKNGKKAGDSGYDPIEGGTSGDSAGIRMSTPTGMGWFPGYAVNLETGERLDMAFGEDSYLQSENGSDMLWNPTSHVFSNNNDPLFGGKHYIYVFGHNGNEQYRSIPAQTPDAVIPGQFKDVQAYDEGLSIYKILWASDKPGMITALSEAYKREVFNDAMWVNIPLLTPEHALLETDVKVRLRVTRQYDKYGTGSAVTMAQGLTPGQYYYVETGPIKHNGKVYNTGSGFTAVTTTFSDTIRNTAGTQITSVTHNYSVLTTINDANGIYEFNTSDIETHTNDDASAKAALDLINIVPNPYYAYSSYEKTTLDNIVKITNLPAVCTISIYTLNGSLIRRYKRADSGAEAKTSLDWDLKNSANIPIASGLYIIHVDVPQVGEKILKWFGVMRPIDLEAY
jgi:hypothetical protein